MVGGQDLATAAGLDATASSIVGLSLGALTGDMLNNNSSLAQAFGKIKPQLISSMAEYGVNKLGDAFGVDPRYTSLASYTTGAVAGSWATNGIDLGSNTMQAINSGLLRGGTQLTINLASEELEIDPLIASLSVNAITGSILGGFNQEGDILKGAYDSFQRSALNFLTFGSNGLDPNSPSHYYQRAAYLSKVVSFTDEVQANGLEETLSKHAASVFTRDAIENIWKRGGIADFLTNNAKSVAYHDRQVTEVDFDGFKSYFDPSTDEMVGRAFTDPITGRMYEEFDATYGFDENGKLVMKKGSVVTLHEAENKRLLIINSFDQDNPDEAVVEMSPIKEGVGEKEIYLEEDLDNSKKISIKNLKLDDDGNIESGRIEHAESGLVIESKEGNINYIRLPEYMYYSMFRQTDDLTNCLAKTKLTDGYMEVWLNNARNETAVKYIQYHTSLIDENVDFESHINNNPDDDGDFYQYDLHLGNDARDYIDLFQGQFGLFQNAHDVSMGDSMKYLLNDLGKSLIMNLGPDLIEKIPGMKGVLKTEYAGFIKGLAKEALEEVESKIVDQYIELLLKGNVTKLEQRDMVTMNEAITTINGFLKSESGYKVYEGWGRVDNITPKDVIEGELQRLEEGLISSSMRGLAIKQLTKASGYGAILEGLLTGASIIDDTEMRVQNIDATQKKYNVCFKLAKPHPTINNFDLAYPRYEIILSYRIGFAALPNGQYGYVPVQMNMNVFKKDNAEAGLYKVLNKSLSTHAGESS